MDAVTRAVQRIVALTPLKTDCGRLCGAACCGGGAEEGMLLFPGEEAFYQGREGFALREVTLEDGLPAVLLVCGGSCRREERPLGCRMFPLMPRLARDGTILGVRMDARGRPLCPLTHGPKAALDPAFLAAVEEACRILAEDPRQGAFLRRLEAQERAVRRLFG